MNAVDPQFVMPIFEGALEAGTHYMDMAASLSVPHPTHPFTTPGLKLGDLQFARHEDWEQSGRLALVGMGMDPGLSDVFARHARDHLFDEVRHPVPGRHSLGDCRDGAGRPPAHLTAPTADPPRLEPPDR